MKNFANVVLILFSAFVILLSGIYLILLSEKIFKPYIKNMNTKDMSLVGGTIALLIIINIFLVKEFRKKRLL